MPSVDLPTATPPAPTPIASSSTPAVGSPSVGATIPTAGDANNFVSMLAQLLDEGAVVVTTSINAAVPEIKGESESSEPDLAADNALPVIGLPDPTLAAWLSPTSATGHLHVTNDVAAAILNDKERLSRLPSILATNAALTNLSKSVSKNTTGSSDASNGTGATFDIGQVLQLLPNNDEATRASLIPGKELDAVETLLAASENRDASVASTSNGTSSSNAAGKSFPTIEARVGTPAWSDEVATRVAFLNERGVQSASLRLTPEHLGPMEIQITVKDDRATVWFGASHAETRTALEQALPRLRELLQAQGLTLTDAGVFREPPREQARAYQSSESSSLAGSADGERTVVTINGRSALVDAYA